MAWFDLPDPILSIIIITRNRPVMLERCLSHIDRQLPFPGGAVELVVVDSSTSEETWDGLARRPGLKRIRIVDGRDNMPEARNLGIAEATGAILAFLDDDSLPATGWLGALLEHYGDPAVGGVGGRLIDERLAPADQPGEPVGRIQRDGRITINFTRRAKAPVEVDHLPGGNMSFRREIVDQVGGFDSEFSGPNFNEETDFCVRVRRRGYRLLYDSRAAVNHMNAPREKGARTGLDRRLVYYSARNKIYFLLKNYRLTWPRLRREFLGPIKWQVSLFLREPGRKSFMAVFYKTAGILAGILAWARQKRPGRRRRLFLLPW